MVERILSFVVADPPVQSRSGQGSIPRGVLLFFIHASELEVAFSVAARLFVDGPVVIEACFEAEVLHVLDGV